MLQDGATDHSSRIADVLGRRYGLGVESLARLPIGESTLNYRVQCLTEDVFVKQYRDDADLEAERAAIGLSELAGRHGVPTAAVRRSADDDVVDTTGGVRLSVWSWASGEVFAEGFNQTQCVQAGDALGTIHRVFADLPASAGPAQKVSHWRSVTVPGLRDAIEQLKGIARGRVETGQADDFDVEALRMLDERWEAAGCMPQLFADLPELASQVVHGDFSTMNLLFDVERLSAVLDFGPPDPFLVAYDLGRIAFFPTTVAGDAKWLSAAETLIAAYLRANPRVRQEDVLACGRVALLQLLRSLFGIKQHYTRPGPHQDALDDFWRARHQAVGVLLDNLEDVDRLLADLVARRRAG
jgi:Ser/Thr protein kinase RdoA (MazF antagonist)